MPANDQVANNGSANQTTDIDEKTETIDQKTILSGGNICKVLTSFNKSMSDLREEHSLLTDQKIVL